MGLNKDGLVVFHKPWFTGTPQNAVKASGTLTFTGIVSDGETVTIGSDVYEFDTNASVTGTNILVDVSGGATAPDAVTALVNAITANTTELVSAADGAGDTVVVTYDFVGTEGNAVATTETCTNGAFGAVTLEGGQYATPSRASMALIEISGTKYMALKPADKWTTDAWYTIALS